MANAERLFCAEGEDEWVAKDENGQLSKTDLQYRKIKMVGSKYFYI
jgi:hypothetical protein